MNQQKGFVNIVLIALIVIVVGAVAYFVLVKEQVPSVKTQQTSSSKETGIPTPSPTTTQGTIDQTRRTEELTGAPVESRKRFIDAGLSKQYFDVHFNLKDIKSGEDAGGQYTFVYWIYSIGEYKTEVVDRINYNRPEMALNTALHDIQIVIPRQQAFEILNSCLKSSLTDAEVGVEYDYRSGFKGQEGGKLYLAGSVQDGQQGFVVITQTRVNLENGKCDPVSQNKIYN